MPTITYAIDPNTGLIWSRVGSHVAIPVLNYGDMTPANNFNTAYHLEKFDVLSTLPSINYVKWTRKIPAKIKNQHRRFWGLKLLA